MGFPHTSTVPVSGSFTLDSLYFQLHNEDDSTEVTTTGQSSAVTEATATSNPVVVTTEGEAPPPSYASLTLGATAAPGAHSDLNGSLCGWSFKCVKDTLCVCVKVCVCLSVCTETAFSEDFPVPPPYSVATSLPTYDEVEKAKAAELAASTVDTVPRVKSLTDLCVCVYNH